MSAETAPTTPSTTPAPALEATLAAPAPAETAAPAETGNPADLLRWGSTPEEVAEAHAPEGGPDAAAPAEPPAADGAADPAPESPRLTKAHAALAAKEKRVREAEAALEGRRAQLEALDKFAGNMSKENFAAVLAALGKKPEEVAAAAARKTDPAVEELRQEVERLKAAAREREVGAAQSAYREGIITVVSDAARYPILSGELEESQQRVYDLIAEHAELFQAKNGRPPRRAELLAVERAAEMLETRERERFEARQKRLTSNQNHLTSNQLRDTVGGRAAPAPSPNGAPSPRQTAQPQSRASLTPATPDSERVAINDLSDEARAAHARSLLRWVGAK